MTKIKAYQSFWEQFGVPVYDVTSVPDDAKLPYITYELSTDTFDHAVALTASIWTRSTSWKTAYDILNLIEGVVLNGGANVPYDEGSIWITSASPWCMRTSDSLDTLIKRLVLNLYVEFI